MDGIIMTSNVEELYEQHLKSLSLTELNELLVVIERLIQHSSGTSQAPHRHWQEIAGAATYPLTGQDAQDWVSQSRLDSDRRDN